MHLRNKMKERKQHIDRRRFDIKETYREMQIRNKIKERKKNIQTDRRYDMKEAYREMQIRNKIKERKKETEREMKIKLHQILIRGNAHDGLAK